MRHKIHAQEKREERNTYTSRAKLELCVCDDGIDDDNNNNDNDNDVLWCMREDGREKQKETYQHPTKILTINEEKREEERREGETEGKGEREEEGVEKKELSPMAMRQAWRRKDGCVGGWCV